VLRGEATVRTPQHSFFPSIVVYGSILFRVTVHIVNDLREMNHDRISPRNNTQHTDAKRAACVASLAAALVHCAANLLVLRTDQTIQLNRASKM
jgi:diacylglycerol kinase